MFYKKFGIIYALIIYLFIHVICIFIELVPTKVAFHSLCAGGDITQINQDFC